jgi:SAM-dependent methyltransferase
VSAGLFRRRRFAGALLAAACLAPRLLQAQTPGNTPVIDGGPYVPTPLVVVEEMLKLAEVNRGDAVYDLGSGDGRMVIEAARIYGARAVGVERDAELVERSRSAALRAGVADRVQFIQDDLFNADLRAATVVTLYLLPQLLERLVPKLRAELPRGARIVSHDFPLESWPLEQTRLFEVEEKARSMGFGTTQLFLYRA